MKSWKSLLNWTTVVLGYTRYFTINAQKSLKGTSNFITKRMIAMLIHLYKIAPCHSVLILGFKLNWETEFASWFIADMKFGLGLGLRLFLRINCVVCLGVRSYSFAESVFLSIYWILCGIWKGLSAKTVKERIRGKKLPYLSALSEKRKKLASKKRLSNRQNLPVKRESGVCKRIKPRTKN